MVKDILEKRDDLRKYLYIRSFLITNDDFSVTDEFPFYGNWNQEKVGNYNFCTQKLQKFYHVERGDKVFFMIGHAYNPFTMDCEENVILEKISLAFDESKEKILVFEV